MLEIAQNFEKIANSLSPALLLMPGLLFTAIGLVIWLAGLRFAKIVIAVTAAIASFIIGFFATKKIAPAIVIAGLLAVLSFLFERIFVAILAAALINIISFTILSEHDVKETAAQTITKNLNINESIKILAEYVSDSASRIKNMVIKMSASNWAIIAVLALIAVITAFFVGRLTCAICLAALGTILIFSGMILLLLFKGALVITAISAKISFYSAVFCIMVSFGAFEQLIFCQIPKEKPIMKKSINKDKQD